MEDKSAMQQMIDWMKDEKHKNLRSVNFEEDDILTSVKATENMIWSLSISKATELLEVEKTNITDAWVNGLNTNRGNDTKFYSSEDYYSTKYNKQ